MPETQPELPAAFELRYMDKTENLRQRGIQIATEGAGEGTIIWAKSQSTAQGRCSNSWDPGENNLHCCIILTGI